MDQQQTPADDVLLRGMTLPRVSRRGFLKAGSLAAVLGVAACAAPAQKSSATASGSGTSFWKSQKLHHRLNFANQSNYIDHGSNSTLDQFTAKTGIKVNYREVIESDETWFAKVQPELAGGQATGWDLAVLGGDHYMTDLIKLGYLTELDHSLIPNFANVSATFKNPPWDPGNRYTMPWQSGFSGIMYNPDKVPHPITSWNDLQDPALKGRVSMMDDIMQLPMAALLAIGVDPNKSTESDWKKALTWLNKQRSAGIVREYTQTSYSSDMLNGNLWACQAYSGDAYQLSLSGAKFKFVMPKEGVPQWVDNMVIMSKAANPLDAITWMNWIYRPDMAARLEEALNDISPVSQTRAYIAKDARAATGKKKTALNSLESSAESFPSAAQLKKAYPLMAFSSEKQFQTFSSMFTPVWQS
jgi:spermidine/putrescine transport system substrate-binding protein